MPNSKASGENESLAASALTSDAVRNAEVRIVALGASSGGLKALELFFRNLPIDSGMAFVLAMHLSPEHKSQMARILQAFTAMPVKQVSTDEEVASNHVYVIAPGQHISIRGSRMHVTLRGHPEASGAIDHLFGSLAEDRQEQAIGIVLSGSGSDGTLGLRAINESGGLVLVQDPHEAEVDAMPRSAIATGVVDFILPAAEMPSRLIAFRDLTQLDLSADGGILPVEDEHALQDILTRMLAQTGYDVSHYKRTTLLRQIGRRMLVLHAEDLPAYARRVEEDPGELGALRRNLLVGVTQFFRDPESYLMLEHEVLPELFDDAGAGGDGDPAVVRVWVPGCATGEEAYSLAMLFAEFRDAADVRVPLQILAVDIDETAVNVARRGRYPEKIAATLTSARLKRFFRHKEGAYEVSDELRALVVFAAHDLTRDPPFARIDLLSCRNLLMYFEADMQQHVLARCAYSLRPGGYLFLGSAEGTGRNEAFFTTVSKKHGLFRRTVTQNPSASLTSFPLIREFAAGHGPSVADPAPVFLSPTEIAGDEASVAGRIDTVVPNEVGGLKPSNEALILANQEMQSLNEELRSTMEELEVAKEELQSLNEELSTVNQELQNKIEEHRRVNSDLHLLIESTHLATLFLDPQLNVVLYTPESTKLFNLLPIDIGRPLEHLSHRLTYADLLDDARQVLASALEVTREVQAQDRSWYFMRIMPYPTPAGPAEGVVITFADITSQKRVAQVSEDRFALAFHAGPVAASIATREDGRFMDVNEHFERITGYSREEVIGQPARTRGLFFGDNLEAASKHGDGIPVLHDVETQIRTKTGAIHDLIVSTTAIEFEGQPCYLNLFYDVTERKRLEREILMVSDREQRRIGRDLHDGLGAHMTGLAMMARGLARDMRAGRSVDAEAMDEIARLLGDGVDQARRLAQGLNPFMLEVGGLTVALRELATNLKVQAGIFCTIEEEGAGTAPNHEQSMHLYRITQEALSNAARHAQATRVHITLSRTGSHLELSIHDDGMGFEATEGENARGPASGMGLSIMRHRAEMIGGKLSVDSTPGAGTTITCSLQTAN